MKTTKKTKQIVPAKKPLTPAKSSTSVIQKNETPIITSPFWNIWETDKAFKIRVLIPGHSIKDIVVNINGNNLVISSIKKDKLEKKQKNYVVRQYSYSAWNKSISLPQAVDTKKIKVNFKDGVLKIDLHKLSQQTKLVAGK